MSPPIEDGTASDFGRYQPPLIVRWLDDQGVRLRFVLALFLTLALAFGGQ